MRVMPHGEGAGRRVSGEVAAQPGQLGVDVESFAERLRLEEVRVQDDDVPAVEVVAVIADGSLAGGDAEVTEIARARRVPVSELVVSGRGVDALLEPAPGVGPAPRAVRPREIRVHAVGIRVVAQREHGAENCIYHGGRLR